MKYETYKFTEILSGLYQQGAITSDKRNLMVKAWMKSQKEGDKETMRNILEEIYVTTSNSAWKANIQDAIEEL